jgi:hypothetical protein
MAADGELGPEQEVALRAHLEGHPGDAERIEFERRLREACRCACSPDCCAPAGLRDRVLACCGETGLADRLDDLAAETRQRGFWAGRFVARFGAVAALLALVAVMAVMVSRSTSPLDGGGPGAVDPGVMIDRVARFARREHERCDNPPSIPNSKFTVHEPGELESTFADLAGREVSLASILEAQRHGLEFVDAGRCHLPGGGTAMHIRFQAGGPTPTIVSLWAWVDGSVEIEEGVVQEAGEGFDCVRLWRVGETVFVMVCPNMGAAPMAGEAFQCPGTCKPVGTP